MLLQVLAAIVLSLFAGSLIGKEGILYRIVEVGGDLFLNALTLLVVPLIASSIISGIGQMHSEASFKSLGIKTFVFYILTIIIAVLIGVVWVSLLQPGTSHREHIHALAPVALTNHSDALVQVLYKLVPNNIIGAAAQGNMLGIIFFSLLFGFALIRIETPLHNVLLNVWKGLFSTLMGITQFVMKAMPIGVFCLVTKVIAAQGLQTMGNLAYFFLTVLAALFTFCFILLPLLLKFFGINPFLHIKTVSPALFTAFSTSSSAASLPVTMECMEKGAGISNRVCSFVLPLGTSMNMAGSALYECVAVLFIAQAYGIELSFTHQILVALLALITSMGVAGIPSASLVAILIILKSLGLPSEGLALILPVDRLLDMCRTTANVFSDTTCASLVAHTEGEKILRPSKYD